MRGKKQATQEHSKAFRTRGRMWVINQSQIYRGIMVSVWPQPSSQLGGIAKDTETLSHYDPGQHTHINTCTHTPTRPQTHITLSTVFKYFKTLKLYSQTFSYFFFLICFLTLEPIKPWLHWLNSRLPGQSPHCLPI